jgi:hypothetical protein
VNETIQTDLAYVLVYNTVRARGASCAHGSRKEQELDSRAAVGDLLGVPSGQP